MKRILVLLFSVVVVFCSCINRAEQAALYNDHIIEYESRIMKAFDDLDSTFSKPDENAEQMEYAFADLQAKIKMSKLALDSIGPFRRDPTLQKAARELFAELDIIVDTDYSKLIGLIKLPDSLRVQPEIADSQQVVQLRIEGRMGQVVNRFIEVQREFGNKYNITFE